jgi:hypothetical protein
MKSRDAIIGFIFLVILVAGTILIFRNRSSKNVFTPLPTPTIVSGNETRFPNLTIPDGVERTDLKAVNGSEGFGVATRTEILANLPEPKPGEKYQAYLENTEGKSVLLGSLRSSKSGWIIEYDAAKYPGYNKVIVTRGINRVLEGSF